MKNTFSNNLQRTHTRRQAQEKTDVSCHCHSENANHNEYHSMSARMSTVKKCKITSVRDDVEKLDPVHSLTENVQESTMGQPL